MNELVVQVEAARSRMLRQVRELVEIESPSEDVAAVNRAMDRVAGWAGQAAGPNAPLRIVRHSQAGFADVMELWFNPVNNRKRKPLLVLGHLDTVWATGTLAGMPWRELPDAAGRQRLWGPGVLDMKAGVLMALFAVQAVQAQNRFCRPVCLLLNPDEEVGSPVSRPHTERLARTAEAVFVVEPAQGLPGSADNAAYKTARKGVGHYRLQVRGVSSHAGVDFQAGHSAILELAKLLPRIAALTDLSRGTTVNPGVIGGGTRSNVVAADAWAEVDVRLARAEDGAGVDAALRALRCADPVCTLTVEGGVNRPPMERSLGTVRLFQQARQLAKEIGFDLPEAATGGGSDGNFTAALGVPTLDGMGAVGEGAHAAGESILLDELVPRTALLAGMIAAV